MVNSGDLVHVTETDPNADVDVVSPAIVTHVYTEDDANGDTAWWNAVKDRGVCDVSVFRRDGSVTALTGVSKSETYEDENGQSRKRAGTYETSAGGPDVEEKESPEQESSTVTGFDNPATPNPEANPGQPPALVL